MSDTPPALQIAQPPLTPAEAVLNYLQSWGATIVSVYALTIFLTAMIIAFLMRNEVLIVALLSVAATNATTVVSYWVGSSHSSAKKDTIIAAQIAPQLLSQPASRITTPD